MQKEIKIRLRDHNYRIVLPSEGSSYYKRHKKVFQALFKQMLRGDLFGGHEYIRIIYPKNRKFELFHSINVTIDNSTSSFILQKLSSLDYSLDEIMLSKDEVPLVYLDQFYFNEVKAEIQKKEKKQKAKILKRKEERKREFAVIAEPLSLGKEPVLKKNDEDSISSATIPENKSPSETRVIPFAWNQKECTFVKTNHLYEKRNGKPRIDKFTDLTLKSLILEALKDPKVQTYETFALVFPKDKGKSNYYSLLLNFNKKNHVFVIITIFAEDDKYRKLFHFPTVKNAVILEDISLEELSGEKVLKV